MRAIWERIQDWEHWPFWLRYFDITPTWLMYTLRSGTPWWFTPSNPTLTFGGFEGESKKEMYVQLPPDRVPRTAYIDPGMEVEALLQRIAQGGFSYPFIVKPDVGMAGILFRKIRTEEELLRYHHRIPVEYLVQELVTLLVEYSVFYHRMPGENNGVVTGFLQKTPLHVVGDGDSTIAALIRQHPQAKLRLEELMGWHESRLDEVLPAGEIFYLSYAANLNRGATFRNLHKEIDGELHATFDALNLQSKTFFYGRYDLKAASLEDLKAGNFLVLEYNGCGAEPNHIYHSGMRLREAQDVVLCHWAALYRISKYNRLAGHKPWPLKQGRKFLRASQKHFALLQKLDKDL